MTPHTAGGQGLQRGDSASPSLLDLFCGAGGAATGYHRAGFTRIVGVDHRLQKHYPFEFVLGDALEYVAEHGHEFDVIHASPPCQGYSRMRHLPWLKGKKYPMLIEAVRDSLIKTGRPWVIENVQGAPLIGIRLCGTMFGLKVYRHRLFESSEFLMQPPHGKHRVVIGKGPMFNDRSVGSNTEGFVSFPRGINRTCDCVGQQTPCEVMGKALGIDWMTRDELSQAIPPAYTEFIGRQILQWLRQGER